MKKTIVLIISLIISFSVFSQNVDPFAPQSASESGEGAAYKLFPTQNASIFLKLDTRNGRIWQVQFSDVDSERSFVTPLSTKSLVKLIDEEYGRFTLYPTEKIYIFLLLDQFDGNVWQVQWSLEKEKRSITPIYIDMLR